MQRVEASNRFPKIFFFTRRITCEKSFREQRGVRHVCYRRDLLSRLSGCYCCHGEVKGRGGPQRNVAGSAHSQRMRWRFREGEDGQRRDKNIK